MIKRRGPRTEPCGTPQKQVWREEKLLSHLQMSVSSFQFQRYKQFSRSLCFNFTHYFFRKKLILIVFSTAPRIFANLNENYRRYNFQAFAKISENI